MKDFFIYFPNERQIAIDESMVPYFGNHSAKQFTRGKPIRFGYKCWCGALLLAMLFNLNPIKEPVNLGTVNLVSEGPWYWI